MGRVVTRNASVYNLCDEDMRDISMMKFRMDIVTPVVCRQNMSVVLQIGIVYISSFDIKKGYGWIYYHLIAIGRPTKIDW